MITIRLTHVKIVVWIGAQPRNSTTVSCSTVYLHVLFFDYVGKFLLRNTAFYKKRTNTTLALGTRNYTFKLFEY